MIREHAEWTLQMMLIRQLMILGFEFLKKS
jgi:hypothetical protein